MIAWMDFRVMKWPEELIQEMGAEGEERRMAGVFLQVKHSNTCFLYGCILLINNNVFFQKHRDVCISVYLDIHTICHYARKFLLVHCQLNNLSHFCILGVSTHFPGACEKHESQDPIFTRAPRFDEGSSSACTSQEPMK